MYPYGCSQSCLDVRNGTMKFKSVKVALSPFANKALPPPLSPVLRFNCGNTSRFMFMMDAVNICAGVFWFEKT